MLVMMVPVHLLPIFQEVRTWLKKMLLGCLLAVGEKHVFQDWNVYFFASVIGASPFGNLNVEGCRCGCR